MMAIYPGTCGLNVPTFVLQLRKKPGENSVQEIDLTGNGTRARWMRGNDVVTSRPQLWPTGLLPILFPMLRHKVLAKLAEVEFTLAFDL